MPGKLLNLSRKAALALLVAAMLLAALPSALATGGVVNVFNWEDYINDEAIALFERETGIKVNYMNFTLNEDMLVQVRTSPGAFDVVFPSDYAIERMIAEGLLQKLDFSKLPNAEQTLEWLRSPDYDPLNEYSVPYMWGTVGILYDTARVQGPVDSWGALFDEAYRGEVFMLDSPRDTLGVALKYLGYSMNSKNPAEIQEAANLLIEQKQKGIVKAYQVDETKDKMVAGEGILAVVWSGDAQYAIDLNPDLAYVIPKEGTNVWVDGMVIPAGARNVDNAHAFIDFLCRPDVAAMNTEYIWYSSPNAGAIELLGEDYTENPNLNPSEEQLAGSEYFHDNQDVKVLYDTFWGLVKNAR
ncbi:MAG TPA: spermidine/putrescine ABC transporter substrate-binding protein [Candidatus Limnocylindria bacterium]|nr:spermidine/putrescine ABC transporter substrate-binding protein [Candidatus Limnocylindria bacterium]